MSYSVVYTRRALKQLQKLDRFTARRITSWIGDHLEGTDDPRRYGKALAGNHGGEWRYRVGTYRILCFIKDEALIVEAFKVGHRSDVYD